MIDFLESLPEIFEPPVLDDDLHAPFPYFGGKRRAAEIIWDRLGDVTNYVEPFAGSCAVLLARPAWHEARVETCNDLDSLAVDFWRATALDPENVARLADWPVFEVDLHARHKWLIKRRASLAAELEADPYAYDLEAAAWWAWGASCWIGAGWCADTQSRVGAANNEGRKRPELAGGNGQGAAPKDGKGPRPGQGVQGQEHRGPSRRMPDISGVVHTEDGSAWPRSGKGVNSEEMRAPSRRMPDVSAGRHWDGESAQARDGKGLHGSTMREPSRQLPTVSATATSSSLPGLHANSMRAPVRSMPDLGGSSRGEDRWPNTGKGLNAAHQREPSRQLCDLGGTGTIGGNGIHSLDRRTALHDTFARLAARLRYVRFPCGDWKRVVTPAVTWRHGLTGVVLDPPYPNNRTAGIYAEDSLTVAHEVRAWAIEAGKRSDMRIALCGYEGDHAELEALGWSVVEWKARGGYGNQGKGRGRENAKRERIWFSPACVPVAQLKLF